MGRERVFILAASRDQAWRHPKAQQIQRWLHRICAKTGRVLEIEPVTI